MREILFRGKRKDNGEWAQSHNILQLNNDKVYVPNSREEIFYAENEAGNVVLINGELYSVIPETVGQYTGLHDKNGTKIFEGDIVREYGGEFAQGFYEMDRNLIVEIPNTLANFILGSDCGCKYKIIGNIHDNPELLKGGAE